MNLKIVNGNDRAEEAHAHGFILFFFYLLYKQ